MMRRLLLALVLACLAWPAAAADRIPIFDAHLHYNWEPTPRYPLDEVLALFHANGITGILATSRPNDGTHALTGSGAKDLRVVPFLRPYRTRADIQTWFDDPAIYALVETEFKRGGYRGLGEFHIHGQSAAGPLVKKFVDFAVANDLYLHAHCDTVALELLFAHNPKSRIIWAHTGFTTPAARVDELLRQYPALWGELSYRGGIAEGGTLTPEWRALFDKHSDRFLLGSDTWTAGRWESYGDIMDGYRAWLAQLPRDIAERIAFRNAEALFR